jgi:phage tail-like protein
MVATTEIGKHDPLLANMFAIELDNGIKGVFTEVAGLGIEVGVAKSSQAWPDGKVLNTNRPTTASYQDITLKRPFSADKSFWDWIKKVADGKIRDSRTNGAIVMYNSTPAEAGRWTFTEAWPSKWSVSDLDAGSDDLMVETVVITIELLKREK